jgi:hypothetical protein
MTCEKARMALTNRLQALRQRVSGPNLLREHVCCTSLDHRCHHPSGKRILLSCGVVGPPSSQEWLLDDVENLLCARHLARLPLSGPSAKPSNACKPLTTWPWCRSTEVNCNSPQATDLFKGLGGEANTDVDTVGR